MKAYRVVGSQVLTFGDTPVHVQLPQDVKTIRLKTEAVCKVAVKRTVPVAGDLVEPVVPGGYEPERDVEGGMYIGAVAATGGPSGELVILYLN